MNEEPQPTSQKPPGGSPTQSILNDDEFFGDTVDTPKEGIEQHRKREYLKSVTSKGTTYFGQG